MFSKLITMQGNPGLNPLKMNNFEAGIHFLATVSKIYPGVTFRELAALSRTGRMNGWFTDLKHVAGDVKDGIADTLGSVTSKIGDVLGSATRLASDPNVASAVARGASAYATGGASEAAGAMFGQTGPADKNTGFMESLGDAWKSVLGAMGANKSDTAMAGFSWPAVLVIGSVVVGAIVFTRRAPATGKG